MRVIFVNLGKLRVRLWIRKEYKMRNYNNKMKLLVVGDPHGVLPKKIPKEKFDAIIITGDLGKADLGRKFFFENIRREKEGLPKKKATKKEKNQMKTEVEESTLKILKFFSRFKVPIYTLVGNVPFKKRKMKNVNIVQNKMITIRGMKFAFLENFVEMHWFKEFKVKDKNRMKKGRKETLMAKKIINKFSKHKADILVSHLPPYGILDKFDNPIGQKHWQGKHAGSKLVLAYIKKYQPKYVFCGHMHEAKGKAKIGKTIIYNVGYSGDYLVKEV